MVELVEEPITLDDRVLQLNAFNGLHRMRQDEPSVTPLPSR